MVRSLDEANRLRGQRVPPALDPMPVSGLAVNRSTVEHGMRITLAATGSRAQPTRGLQCVAYTPRDRRRALFGAIWSVMNASSGCG